MKTLLLGMTVFSLLPTGLRATSAQPALEVLVLGSGGPRAFGRAGSSYIVVVEGRPRILVDAGPGAFLRIGELDVNLEKVDTVFREMAHSTRLWGRCRAEIERETKHALIINCTSSDIFAAPSASAGAFLNAGSTWS